MLMLMLIMLVIDWDIPSAPASIDRSIVVVLRNDSGDESNRIKSNGIGSIVCKQ